MNNNYVDSRTPEEKANEPESFVTTATALNKDTLNKDICTCGHERPSHKEIPFNPNYTQGNCVESMCECNYFNIK